MKIFLRVLLAVLFSPIWIPPYLLMLLVIGVAAVAFNVVLFIGKGEWDAEPFRTIPEFATFRLFRRSKEGVSQK